jgi:hypothetical protein
VPGVRETAITSALPLQGWGYGVPYSIADRELTDRANRHPAFFKIISPSYSTHWASSCRTRVERQRHGERTARRAHQRDAGEAHFGEDPIGRHILVRDIEPGKTDFGQRSPGRSLASLRVRRLPAWAMRSCGMAVSNQRARPAPSASCASERAHSPAETIQSAIDRVNRDQALSDAHARTIVNQSMLANRVTSTILAVFASIALLLAAGGIYGVVSYTAAQRTHEMGIRAALGASAGHLRRLIFQGGMQLTVIGLLIGLAGTDVTTRVVSSMLYGVGNDDPLTIAAVAAVLFGVAGLACFLPAWRVTKVDPMEALRNR